MQNIKQLKTPLNDDEILALEVGDHVLLSGRIYCGRDAVLPKICELIKANELNKYNIELNGSVIFHTAVSPAGVGPTSSNKVEIENSLPILSSAGVKLHLGKGALTKETISILDHWNSVYAVIPPITALLVNNTLSKKLIAFYELGMEAFYELDVIQYPIIIAAAHNKSIYKEG